MGLLPVWLPKLTVRWSWLGLSPRPMVAIGGATVGPDAGGGAVAVLRASGNSIWKALCTASSMQRLKSPVGGGAWYSVVVGLLIPSERPHPGAVPVQCQRWRGGKSPSCRPSPLALRSGWGHGILISVAKIRTPVS